MALTARSAVVALLSGTMMQLQPPAIRLIVHADDVGMALSVNRAVFAALERGTVSSMSVMVPGPAFDDAVARILAHPGVDVGVHLTLTSEWAGVRWGPVLPREQVPSLVDASGKFRQVWDPIQVKPAEVELELRAQIKRARDAGLPISHLDVHQFVLYHSGRVLAEILARISRDEDLPVLLARHGLPGSEEVAAALPGTRMLDNLQTIGPAEPPGRWMRYYEMLVRDLPPGVSEVIVHPGYDDSELRAATAGADAWGAAWRQRELDVLMSDQFRQLLEEHHVLLVQWHGLKLPETGNRQ
jgi:hypothetical protein